MKNICTFKQMGQAVLATVVDSKGSSYRLPGARTLTDETAEASARCILIDVLHNLYYQTQLATAVLDNLYLQLGSDTCITSQPARWRFMNN